MNHIRTKYHTLLKCVAMAVICLFLQNTVVWAYPPERMDLAVQSIFNPLGEKEIRDFGIIKYFLTCLAKTIEDFDKIPGDVNVKIGTENIDVALEFSARTAPELHFLIDSKPDSHIIPCSIDHTRYYAFVTMLPQSDSPEITVFTETEFQDLKKTGIIAHGSRSKKEELHIHQEEKYDAALTIVHGKKDGTSPVPWPIIHNALSFFADFGANDDFYEAAKKFCLEARVSTVPRKSSLTLIAGEKPVEIPISIDNAHASDRYINIPEDTSLNIFQALVHELSAKCGMSHEFNEELEDIAGKWHQNKGWLDFSPYMKIREIFANMRFRNLKSIKERDLANDKTDEKEKPLDPGIYKTIQRKHGERARRLFQLFNKTDESFREVRGLLARIFQNIRTGLNFNSVCNLIRLGIDRLTHWILYLIARFSDRVGIERLINRLNLNNKEQVDSFNGALRELIHAEYLEDQHNFRIVEFSARDQYDKEHDLIVYDPETEEILLVEVASGVQAGRDELGRFVLTRYVEWVKKQTDEHNITDYLMGQIKLSAAGVFSPEKKNDNRSVIITYDELKHLSEEEQAKVVEACKKHVIEKLDKIARNEGERKVARHLAPNCEVIVVPVSEKHRTTIKILTDFTSPSGFSKIRKELDDANRQIADEADLRERISTVYKELQERGPPFDLLPPGFIEFLAERFTSISEDNIQGIDVVLSICTRIHDEGLADELLEQTGKAKKKKQKEKIFADFLEKANHDEDPPAGLIGKYVPTSEIKFIETETGSVARKGHLHFTAYNIDDPAKNEIKIRINAERAPPGTFENYRRTGIPEIDDVLNSTLNKIPQFILDPNLYDINGIGTGNILAISRPLSKTDIKKSNEIAFFHELAHAAGIDVTPYIDGGKEAVDRYIMKEGKEYRQLPQMRTHYALRLFQRQKWSEEDPRLSMTIRTLQDVTPGEKDNLYRYSQAVMITREAIIDFISGGETADRGNIIEKLLDVGELSYEQDKDIIDSAIKESLEKYRFWAAVDIMLKLAELDQISIKNAKLNGADLVDAINRSSGGYNKAHAIIRLIALGELRYNDVKKDIDDSAWLSAPWAKAKILIELAALHRKTGITYESVQQDIIDGIRHAEAVDRADCWLLLVESGVITYDSAKAEIDAVLKKCSPVEKANILLKLVDLGEVDYKNIEQAIEVALTNCSLQEKADIFTRLIKSGIIVRVDLADTDRYLKQEFGVTDEELPQMRIIFSRVLKENPVDPVQTFARYHDALKNGLLAIKAFKQGKEPDIERFSDFIALLFDGTIASDILLDMEDHIDITAAELILLRLNPTQLDILRSRLKNVTVNLESLKKLNSWRYVVLYLHNLGIIYLSKGFIDDLFPQHEEIRSILGKGKKEVLLVQNRTDGLGDEMIRNYPFILGLIQLNPEIKITVITRKSRHGKVYPLDDPHLRILDLDDIPAEEAKKTYDMVIHNRNANVLPDKEWELKRQTREPKGLMYTGRPAIFLQTPEARFEPKSFQYENFLINGNYVNIEYPYNANAYISPLRTAMELGLRVPLRTELSRKIMTSRDSRKKAGAWWRKNVGKSTNAVIFNGFGGEKKNKGITDIKKLEKCIRKTLSAVDTSIKVLIMMNHNTTNAAEKYLRHKFGDNKRIVFMPRTGSGESRINGIFERSSGVVTVEGAAVHTSILMGKPLLTLFVKDGGPLQAHPAGWFPIIAEFGRQEYIEVDMDNPATAEFTTAVKKFGATVRAETGEKETNPSDNDLRGFSSAPSVPDEKETKIGVNTEETAFKHRGTLQKLEDIDIISTAPGDTGHEQADTVSVEKNATDREIVTKVQENLAGENWWLRRYWQRKGPPKEQVTIVINARRVDIYNWMDEPLGRDQISAMAGIIERFSVIAGGKALEEAPYILIDNEQPANEMTGEPQNGRSGIRAITLYPNALKQAHFRIPGVKNLEGTLAHEFTHYLVRTLFWNNNLHEKWTSGFGWDYLPFGKGITLPGGFYCIHKNTVPGSCVTDYASLHPDEDICDSMAAVLLNPEELSGKRHKILLEKRKFLLKEFPEISTGKADHVKTRIFRAQGEEITLPELNSPHFIKAKKTPPLFTIIPLDNDTAPSSEPEKSNALKDTKDKDPGDGSGLIGKYVPTSEVKFIETDRALHKGYIHLTAYRIDDPSKKEIDIRIAAERAPPGLFDRYRRSGEWEIDRKIDKYLSWLNPEKRLILKPNKYGINGIGHRDIVAVSVLLAEPYIKKSNEIALFHELAHAAIIKEKLDYKRYDLFKYIVKLIRRESEWGETALESYLEEKATLYGAPDTEKERREWKRNWRVHYALRLFQKQKWPKDDARLSRTIKTLQDVTAGEQDVCQTIDDIEIVEVKKGDPGYDNPDLEFSDIPVGEMAPLRDRFIRQRVMRSNWWLDEEWRENGRSDKEAPFSLRGNPKEQVSLSIDGFPVDVYNWNDQQLSEEQIAEIVRSLKRFSTIADGEILKKCRYILITDVQCRNPKSGLPMRGFVEEEKNAIVLSPEALEANTHREIQNVPAMEGTMIHELSHILLEDLKKEGKGGLFKKWKDDFKWRSVPRRPLSGMLPSTYLTREPERCVTEYATYDPYEDFCESMVAAVKNPWALDKKKLDFLLKKFPEIIGCITSKIDSAAYTSYGNNISLPRLHSPQTYRINTPPRPKTRDERVHELLGKAETVVTEFTGSLYDLALNLQNDEKVLLAIDSNLGREGTANMVRSIIKDICDIKQNKQLEKLLQNLIIINGKGGHLADEVNTYTSRGKEGITIKKSNVIMLTRADNEKNCISFRDEAVITFVDDSKLNMLDYYPIVELTLFTIAKALHVKGVNPYTPEKLISLYRSLNAKPLDDSAIIAECIDKRSITLTLEPAEPFDYKELQQIYKRLREFLAAA